MTGYLGEFPVLSDGSSAPEDAEILEELPEVSEMDMALAELGGMPSASSQFSERAHELSREDDDIPVIPEDLGLELVDETELSEIIDFLDTDGIRLTAIQESESLHESIPELELGEADLLEELDTVEVLEDAEAAEEIEAVEEAEAVEEFAAVTLAEFNAAFLRAEADTSDLLSRIEAMEFPSNAAQDTEDLLEEVEFEVFLSTLDLSALEGWNDEEGFLDFDLAAVREDLREENLDDLPLAGDEVEILSDEDRERLEELPAFEATSAPAELEESVGALASHDYIPFDRRTVFAFRPQEGELENLGDGELPEAEPLEEFTREESAAFGEDVILYRNGIYSVNRDAVGPDQDRDPSLAALAEEVLKSRR